MPERLRTRSTTPEQMDTAFADFAEYALCLRDLTRVNVVTRTHAPVLAWLRRQVPADGAFSLCDIGCGEGDLLRAIHRRFPNARLTGVDRHPWSIRAARDATPASAQIEYIEADLFSLTGLDWDFIVSSQFAHHLTDDELVRFIQWQEAHAARGWYIADLHRHWLSYYGFPLLGRVMRWHKLVREDGQVSIARAFRPKEWRAVLGRAGVPSAQVRWHVPFRLCVSRECARS